MVRTIDEGIEILTGIKSGELDDKNEFKKGTINYLVQKKLKHYSEISKEYE